MTAAAFRDSKRKTDRRVFVSFHLLQLLPFRATARRILFEAECLERLNFIHAQVFDADLLQWDCYGRKDRYESLWYDVEGLHVVCDSQYGQK